MSLVCLRTCSVRFSFRVLICVLIYTGSLDSFMLSVMFVFVKALNFNSLLSVGLKGLEPEKHVSIAVGDVGKSLSKNKSEAFLFTGLDKADPTLSEWR